MLLSIIVLASRCNISSKTLLAKRDKLTLRFTCPDDASTCPATVLNKGELHCKDLPKTLLNGQGKLVARLLYFAEFTCNLQVATGQEVMLYAAACV